MANQTGAVVAMLLGFLLAYLAYQFDPFLGTAVGAIAAIIAISVLVATTRKEKSEPHRSLSDLAWGDDEGSNTVDHDR